MEIKRIAVVGGGPAGMMAAIRAGQLQQNVILIEQNAGLGRKLLLSGKGRCNLTNLCDLNSFLERFPKNGDFLRDAFKKFFNRDLIGFFEKSGLKLKTERQLRVFPATDKADSVLTVLKKELAKGNVQVRRNACLKDLIIRDGRVKGLLLSDGSVITAERVILATGGVSYGFTGSTGGGLKIAERLGHAVLPLRPGLVALETRQKYPGILKGLTLKNIRLGFSDGEKEIISPVGELLFTDSGISGPLVLSLSGRVVDRINAGRQVYVRIDLKPALSREQLNARILREIKLNPKKTVKNMLKELLPQRLIDVFLEVVKVDPDKKAALISRQEREDLVSLFKAMRLDIAGPRPINEAMVTRGGISLKEINPRTMESRKIKGLYFAGEMIDVDADTGGFNLQAAFSTGYLAGESASL